MDRWSRAWKGEAGIGTARLGEVRNGLSWIGVVGPVCGPEAWGMVRQGMAGRGFLHTKEDL